MSIFKRKQKELTPEEKEALDTKNFFDCILPSTLKFMADHYIVGDNYCCVWAIREYPTNTSEQALLSQLADRTGVTLRIYHRLVDSMEQRKIVQHSARKNKLMSGGDDVNDAIEAESNLQEVMDMLVNIRKNHEVLLHVAVFIELKARNLDALRELQNDISMELTRAKITVDRLTLRQKEGFLSVIPMGSNQFGAQFERVLPASSAANLYPFNFSGKTDPHGMYIGRDKYGSSVLVDFDRRAEDKTNSNVLILGNSGQGKSYLLKLLLTNIRESGKSVVILDPEAEYEELTDALGGTYIDFMSGRYIINPLEPKAWAYDDDEKEPTPPKENRQRKKSDRRTPLRTDIPRESISDDIDGESDVPPGREEPETFRRVTRLSQHVAFLKDFFRSYKDFTDDEIATIEIMLIKLYAKFGIDERTDFAKLRSRDYPTMRDFYNFCEHEFMHFDEKKVKNIYTEELLQNVCLGIHSMCVGAEAKYFDGHTNIRDDQFVCFGVKGLMETNKRLKDTMLFNILSYMSNQLLGKGNTVAAIDEAYLFLSNLTAIEYIRNCMKRVRKKESAVILASQNVEDFLADSVKEYTIPMLSIPDHRFLFYPGQLSPKVFVEVLRVEASEYDLIKTSCKGQCLYICGNERYLLIVRAPDYKAALFGKAGGR